MVSSGLLILYLCVNICIVCAEYLKDEDVQLQIYSPGRGQNAVALELIIYNRDEEFYVHISGEDGREVCSGTFSRFSADRVKCSYDTTILRDGDNAFHVTITSVATKEIVLDTVSHFFYDSDRTEEPNLSDDISETWDAVVGLVLLVLLWRYGGSAYRGIRQLFVQSSTSGGSPPPPLPPPPPPAYVPPPSLRFEAAFPPPAPALSKTQQFYATLRSGDMRFLQALLVGAVLLVGGRLALNPRPARNPPRAYIVAPSMVPYEDQPQRMVLDSRQQLRYPPSVITQAVSRPEGLDSLRGGGGPSSDWASTLSSLRTDNGWTTPRSEQTPWTTAEAANEAPVLHDRLSMPRSEAAQGHTLSRRWAPRSPVRIRSLKR